MRSADPAPFASFMVARMLKPLPGFVGATHAVSETEFPIEGDDWFWADDNAKALEFLALPQVWRMYPDAVTQMVNFVCAMCEGPLIFRRISAPRFEAQRLEGGEGRFIHSFMNISCDLAKGVVTLGMRFHDGRTSRNAIFTGNYVRFGYGGRVHTVDVESGIYAHAIEADENGARLTWKSRIETRGGLLGRGRHVGDLTYVCAISAHSMFVDFEAQLDIAPGIELHDVAMTFGLDQLSHNDNGIRYEVASAAQKQGPAVRHVAGSDDSFNIPLDRARYWSVYQTSHMAGFAAAIHNLPMGDANIVALRGRERRRRLHWVTAEHQFPGPQRGTVRSGERKIITAGGLYAETELYADTFARHAAVNDPSQPPIDLSVSYDYGAEINALARCLTALKGADSPIGPEETERLTGIVSETLANLLAAYDAHFTQPAKTDPSVVFSRSLAYVAYARAAMTRAGADPVDAAALQELCELIATFERVNNGLDGAPQSGFVMGTEVDALPFVDCHAACLLALVRGMTALGSDTWVDAVDRGLNAFCIDTQRFFHLGERKIDVVCVDFEQRDGNRHRTETFWNFKAAICLQLFNAVRASELPALQAIWEKHRPRLELFDSLMRTRIAASTRQREEGLEVLTSMLSMETNSETQPWVALALAGEV
jgi:hypothetical protein